MKKGSKTRKKTLAKIYKESLGEKLIEAARIGDQETVEFLLRKGADIDARDGDGKTALMWAVNYSDDDMARLLIMRGADVNAVDTYGGTALMDAAHAGCDYIARFLLDSGADVNAVGDGWTALMWAAFHGRTGIARLLIERGADVSMEDKEGWSALDHAENFKGSEAVAFLLRKAMKKVPKSNE